MHHLLSLEGKNISEKDLSVQRGVHEEEAESRHKHLIKVIKNLSRQAEELNQAHLNFQGHQKLFSSFLEYNFSAV